MKLIAPDALDRLWTELGRDFDLRLPVMTPQGFRVLGRPDEGRPALAGGALLAKPTSFFFPQEGGLFTSGEEASAVPASSGRQLLVVGFTPRDLLCLDFIDRFFADGLRDDVYFRLREGAIIAGVSGFSGGNGRLLPPAGGKCDLEFVFTGSVWGILAYSEAGERVATKLGEEAPAEALADVRAQAAKFVDRDEAMIMAASKLLLNDLIPDSFWEEIAASCILCTGCNLVCPTCTCFGVQDWRYADRVERSRMWDSCQLDGFMREASGHNPLGTEALRTRRRIHHKLAADKVRWGELGCLLCGRCDAVCPTGIGIVAVARKMVATFGHLADAQ